MTIWPWKLSSNFLGLLVAASLITSFPQGTTLKTQCMKSITYMLTGHRAKKWLRIFGQPLHYLFLTSPKQKVCREGRCHLPFSWNSESQELSAQSEAGPAYSEVGIRPLRRNLLGSKANPSSPKVLALPEWGPPIQQSLMILSKTLLIDTELAFTSKSKLHFY